jgi:propanol-preferring alcohol dehydrogenase
MQALRLTGWKQAPELQEVPEPEPQAGEVLVRIGGSGACHSDVHLMQEIEEGMLPFRLPFTLGHENAGWVETLGAGVSGLERGQPVAVYGAWGCGRCRPCSQGLEMYCDHQDEMDGWGGGLGADGGMAPFLLVHNSRHLIPLENVTPREAAPLTDAALTPYHAIKRALHDLIPGSTAVVIGIGGLGFYAIQLLESLSPATIIAVDRQSQALQLASDAGATHCVMAGPAAAEEITRLTKNRGAELVLDLVGADDTLALGTGVVRRLGHLMLVGAGGGTVEFGFFSQPNGASMTTTDWGSLPELFELVALAEAGRIRSNIQEFELEDASNVYAAIANGEFHGRAVIVPS